MNNFQYEWYTVDVKLPTGITTIEVKAKSEANARKQIVKWANYTNSEKNLSKPIVLQANQILEIYWETMKMDRKGYQRLY